MVFRPLCFFLSSIFALLSTNAVALELDISDFGSTSSSQNTMPEVLTAARLRQSQLDTPASVTVIESDTIAALGFKDIEEIFRLVPGMLVGYHSGFGENTPSVSYHGTQAAEHRRLQVLIDGRSVFKPGLARVEWADIPLAIEDIDRIEVIRGPNAATYGANSFLGVINILTKHPQVEKGKTIKLTTGTRDTQKSYLNVASQLNDTEFRWTLASKQKSGFDYLNEEKDNNRDSLEAMHTLLRTYTPLAAKTQLETQFGYKDGINEQLPIYAGLIDYNTLPDTEAIDQFAWFKLNHEYSTEQSSHVQVYWQNFKREERWNACLSADLASDFGVPVICGGFNKDSEEVKAEIEYQHTSIWNNALRTVLGTRIRLDEMDSQTVNDGRSQNVNTSYFTSIEYRPFSRIMTNIGGMFESDELNGTNFSPRLGLNFLIANNQTIRFIYSEAIRSPDLYEKQGRLQFTVANPTLLDGTAVPDTVALPVGEADGTVTDETIYSHEISYFGLFQEYNLELDIKLFYDELSGLISESLSLDDGLTNSIQLHQKGAEGRLKWQPFDGQTFMLTLAYLDTEDHMNIRGITDPDDLAQAIKLSDRESGLSADRSGSFTWINQLSSHTQTSIAYYHVENWNPYRTNSTGGFTFSRLDGHVSHDISLGKSRTLTLSGSIQYRLDDDPLLFQANEYADKEHYYVSAQFTF
ncbi:TonB-dependent receptor plug domain-containing protein [Bermanella sp. R86510]|uniref:TonB-dependent receptor plug domain-containing protein n=1 Tax=unclassified Bermanella TaxID=2627862 RepID=UPI0037C80EC4